MFQLLLTVHLLLCFSLIGLVLMQQGKGADAGAVMGGAADSILGAGSAGNFVSRLTTGMAIAFMCTSMLLVRMYNHRMNTQMTVSAPTVDMEGSVMNEEALAAPEENAAKPMEQSGAVPAEQAKPVEKTEAKAEDAAKSTAPASAVPAPAPAAEAKPANAGAQQKKEGENTTPPAEQKK